MNSKIPFQTEPRLSHDGNGCSLVIYKGRSMNPTLVEPELMEVQPIAFDSIKVGDVVLFRCPNETNKNVVHRVIKIQPGALRTRGDNNTSNDPYLVGPDDIIGLVVASWRGDIRRDISGGWRGMALSRLLICRVVAIETGSRFMLSRAYRFLSLLTAPVAKLVLPSRFQPRIIHYPDHTRWRYQLFLANRHIGGFDAATKKWEIRRPYRLIVDETNLPRPH